MNQNIPCHLSNNLEFDCNKKPSFITDRAKLRTLWPGIVFGALLFLLGLYEWLDMFRNGGEEMMPKDTVLVYKPIFAVWFFDLCFAVVGIGMVITNILLYLRYNKYKFVGKKVSIIKRPVFRDKVVMSEELKNYTGVRFRVEFLQSGFLTKNRYVIELYHPNPEKIVPLYLSTSANGVRKKWKEYARHFKLPALINVERGLKVIELKDLNKSVAQQYKAGLIKDEYDGYATLPSSVSFVRKRDKIVLKVRKILWDAYNLLAWLAIIMVGFVLVVILTNLENFKEESTSTIYTLAGIAVIIIIAAVQVLFRKEKLVLKKNKIVNTHKYMLFSTKHNQMLKKDIEEIEVTQNPATGRFFVSIISDDNTITFGAKLPIEDLKWIKSFLIHEII